YILIVALDHGAPTYFVHRGNSNLLLGAIVPNAQLGTVAQREVPHVLTGMDPPVVQAPHLRPLIPGIPPPELIPVRIHPLPGPRLLLIAPGTTKSRRIPLLL